MNNKFDLSEFVPVLTEHSVKAGVAKRAKDRRKELRLSQKELSNRSGVSYASLRRFENMGEISLTSLIKLANALDCMEDFNSIFSTKAIKNLKDFKP